MLIVVGSALGAVLIAVVVIVVARPGQSRGTGTGTVQSAYYTGPFAPATKNPDHTVTTSRTTVTTPVLDIYEDFQCPVCDAFEKANGAEVQKLAFQGKVRVIYHPFTIFLGRAAGPGQLQPRLGGRAVRARRLVAGVPQPALLQSARRTGPGRFSHPPTPRWACRSARRSSGAASIPRQR